MPARNDWNRVRFRLPSHIPSMVSAEERRYLYWLGSVRWQGFGHIVEVGPWLGGSTWCLAAGMQAAASVESVESSRQLHVFDNFVWRDFMNGRGGPDLADGASFEEHFKKNLAPHAERMVVHAAWLPDDEEAPGDAELGAIREEIPTDAERVAWPGSSEPVEILFVDGAKSWQGMIALLTAFADALVPERSLLVFQDYKYWGAYWVAAVVELLADCVTLEHQLRENSVAFRLTDRLDSARVRRLSRFEHVDAERCRDLIEQAGRRLREHGDPLAELVVGLTQLRMYVHKNDAAAAVRAFHRIEASWPLLGCGANLEAARTWLRGATGHALPPVARSRARAVLDRLLRSLRR
ncbi:MAG: hypothetical protein ACYTGW_13880 [Planctomycetota bacterium]